MPTFMHRALPAGRQPGTRTTFSTETATEQVTTVDRAAGVKGEAADTKAGRPLNAGQAIQMNLLPELQLTGLV